MEQSHHFEASRPRSSALAVVFFILLPPLALADEFTGKVIGISDGDTITVLHNGKGERVRLNGIDCPEKGQPFGQRAKEFTAKLAFGQMVRVTPKKIDRHGRTIADVTLPDGGLLQYKLVTAGLAWWFSRYSVNQRLADMEQEARDMKRGLWVDPQPVPPWEWRHRVKPVQKR